MARAPAWTTDEFAALMHAPHLTEVDATHLPALRGRSADAIAVVRQGVHSWHQGRRDTTLLSARMKGWLEQHTGLIACAVCNVRL